MTPRNPERESIGHEVIDVMRLLGWEPMPWQREIFDVAFEVDSFGLLWYTEIVIIVPRQSGKSSLVIPWGVHRMVTWPERQFMLYIAQTRAKALEKLVDEHFYRIEKSPFKRLLVPNRSGKVQPVLSHGDEHLRWKNGSKWAIDAPTEDAGHGGTLGLTIGDEIFAQKDGRLEAALAPATTAVPDAQSLWISTVGESKGKSPFMWGKSEKGRAGVELVRADRSLLNDRRRRSLYIEFSAPEDADWLDPLTWWLCMPALGYTTSEDKIAAFAGAMGEAEFRRAFLNQWGDDLGNDWKIPQGEWEDEAVEVADSQLDREERIYVIDISPERDWASISVAGVNADGKFHLEVIDDAPGTNWIIDGDPTRDLAGIRAIVDHDPGVVYYEHRTTGTLVPDLADAGIEAHPMSALDIAVAAPMLLDYVLNRRAVHIGQAELTDALASASTAPVGGGDGWKWSRGKSLRPITSLVGVSYALRMLALLLPDLAYDPLAALRHGNRLTERSPA